MRTFARSLMVALLAIAPSITRADLADTEEAKEAVSSWLGMIDAGRYEESWQGAAPGLKRRVPLLDWEQAQFTRRVEVGALRSRTFTAAKPVAGDADGEAAGVELRFASEFDATPEVEEVVKAARGADGRWHATSYQFNDPGATAPSDERIRNILRDRIERAKAGVGIVVGIVDAHGRRIVAQGLMDQASGRKVDGETLFEIGSITKTFTATLLADMVVRGEVKLDDPAARYLPEPIKDFRAAGKDVTLLQLATHTSGLPRMPSNFEPKGRANPYADYSAQKMYRYIAAFDHPEAVPAAPLYSNLGFGLLGTILASHAGTTYEALLRERILEPLGMNSTVVEMPASLESGFATAHTRTLKPASRWDLDAFAGAGGIRSSMHDMLLYAAANAGLELTPLDKAMRLAHQGYDSIKAQGLAWVIRGGGDALWHDGATGGFVSSMYVDLKWKRGIVVLANSQNPVDDIAAHLMQPNLPIFYLVPAEKLREVKLPDPKLFDDYVGTYELTPTFGIDFTREGDRYFTQATGQPRAEIFPRTASTFFLKVVDAQVEFVRDGSGRVTHMLLFQNGATTRGGKVR